MRPHTHHHHHHTTTTQIDNLYLDMNGIIHNCTHANDPGLRLTETEMVIRIFTYLDKLLHIMKPRKLVLLAIDGAARRQQAAGSAGSRTSCSNRAAAAAGCVCGSSSAVCGGGGWLRMHAWWLHVASLWRAAEPCVTIAPAPAAAAGAAALQAWRRARR